MKNNNKRFTIGIIILVIVCISILSFFVYKIISNKLENNNINVQENDKSENKDEQPKESITDGYELVDLNTPLTEREDLDIFLNRVVDSKYEIGNNDKFTFSEGNENEFTLGIENNRFYVSFLNKEKYYSNVDNVSKIYMETGCGGELYISLLTKEGDVYVISEEAAMDLEYNHSKTQNYVNSFIKINQSIKYTDIKVWLIAVTTCTPVYDLIGVTENNESYIIENEYKFDYMAKIGKLFIKNDSKIYVDGKYANLNLKYYMYSYIITDDNYLYNVAFERISSKKVKELYNKHDRFSIKYIVIYEDGTTEALEANGILGILSPFNINS